MGILHSNKRKLCIAAAVAVTVMFCASNASALDGYKDRSGLYWGLGGVAGAANLDLETDRIDSGLEGRSPVGGLTFKAGAGVSKTALLGGEIGFIYGQGALENGPNVVHSHTRFMGIVNYFVSDGFHLIGGVGLIFANFSPKTDNEADYDSAQKMGFGGKAGVGYEAFVDGTGAIGGSLTYHYYSEIDTVMDAPLLGVHYRWY